MIIDILSTKHTNELNICLMYNRFVLLFFILYNHIYVLTHMLSEISIKILLLKA